jgi:hypothetical protein
VRLLFIALLLANAIAFALQLYWPRQQPPTPVVTREGDLRLIGELGAGAIARWANSCYSLGPLRDLRIARQLEANLAGRGLSVALREQHSLEPLGYWVYLAPASSLDAAHVTAKRLAERGVTDYVYVVGAEKANAISLGLFSDAEAAHARVAELQRLGFAAQMERRFSRQTVGILHLGPGQAPPELGPGYRWEAADCLEREA